MRILTHIVTAQEDGAAVKFLLREDLGQRDIEYRGLQLQQPRGDLLGLEDADRELWRLL